jgi:NTP pyrophosphatase (non-canonical NTP hydrolase)
MNLNEYQEKAATTATFTDTGILRTAYLTLGLTGEAGEVAEKVKKAIRDEGAVLTQDKKDDIKKELGDVLWYVSQLARVLGFTLDEVAEANLAKLADRKSRGVIGGSGDAR